MTDHEKMACELLADEYDREGMTGEAACVRDGYTGSLDEDCALRAITAAYERGRADMREEAVDKLINADRSGREWVRDSLWASIFRDGIAAIRAIPVEGE